MMSCRWKFGTSMLSVPSIGDLFTSTTS